ncbi:hypothetical protein R1sor_023580 [Riccia sorocarpa]|uniref:CCHC-type domain-containing protein n=1 Tax=Riccia sorocarpa TaxID=122646 RepID=A0ABD3GQA7_9MARC
MRSDRSEAGGGNERRGGAGARRERKKHSARRRAEITSGLATKQEITRRVTRRTGPSLQKPREDDFGESFCRQNILHDKSLFIQRKMEPHHQLPQGTTSTQPGYPTAPDNVQLSPTRRQNWADVVADRTTERDSSQHHSTQTLHPVDWASDINDDQVHQAYNALIQRQRVTPGPNAVRTELDLHLAKESFGMYHKAGIILFTAEEAPRRDKVVEWANSVIVYHRGLQVRIIRELARKHFILVLGSQQQKEELLRDPPKQMGGKAIMLSQWKPDYDYREASKITKQVWVELQFVDPLLLNQGHRMLQTIGQVLFHTVQTSNDLKYAHIRGCVHEGGHTESTYGDYHRCILGGGGGGHIIQEVKYTRLPDSCFRCWQRGHRASDCPNPQTRSSRANTTQASGQRSYAHKGASSPATTPAKRAPAKVIPQWKEKAPPQPPINAAEPEKANSTLPQLDNPIVQPQNEEEANAVDNGTDDSLGTQPLDFLSTPVLPATPGWDLNSLVPSPLHLGNLHDNIDQAVPDETPTQPMQPDHTLVFHTPVLNTQPLQDNISPQEMRIVAKKRILQDRAISPHEEILHSTDRYLRDSQPLHRDRLPAIFISPQEASNVCAQLLQTLAAMQDGPRLLEFTEEDPTPPASTSRPPP